MALDDNFSDINDDGMALIVLIIIFYYCLYSIHKLSPLSLAIRWTISQETKQCQDNMFFISIQEKMCNDNFSNQWSYRQSTKPTKQNLFQKQFITFIKLQLNIIFFHTQDFFSWFGCGHLYYNNSIKAHFKMERFSSV